MVYYRSVGQEFSYARIFRWFSKTSTWLTWSLMWTRDWITRGRFQPNVITSHQELLKTCQIELPSSRMDPILEGTKKLGESPVKNFRWIQLATMFNVFLMGFDQTIAASTYAVIGSEFQSMNQVSWISISYLITSTAFQPLYGYISPFRMC